MTENNKNIKQNLDKNPLNDYNSATERLDKIIDVLKNSDTDFDESLKLYEEAVKIGVDSSNYVTENILLENKNNNEDTDNDDIAAVDAMQDNTTIPQDSKSKKHN